jgi:hypothetical protein
VCDGANRDKLGGIRSECMRGRKGDLPGTVDSAHGSGGAPGPWLEVRLLPRAQEVRICS